MLLMLPMDFSVFPMMEKDSWKVETDMRSVKWLFVVFYNLYYNKILALAGLTRARQCMGNNFAKGK